MSNEAFCRHQPACEGCPLSQLTVAAQADVKREQVLHALGDYPKLQCEVSALKPAVATDGYRLRAKWVSDGTHIGLYDAEHHVVATSECRVLHPLLLSTLNRLQTLMPLPVSVLAFDARVADSGVLLTLIIPKSSAVPPESPALTQLAEQLLRQVPELKGLAYSTRDPDSPQVLGGVPIPLAGATELSHHLTQGRPYHLAVFGGFVQAHAGQASALHDAVEALILGHYKTLSGRRVLELFAGAGALALRLSSSGAHVTASDNFAPSVDLLERTARAQNLKLRARAASAEQELAEAGDYEVVIVDPPRRGLSVEVRSALGQRRVPLLLYVSCDPKTLARDLSHLSCLGYTVESVKPFDLIPHSAAVEALVALVWRGLPQPEVLYRDATLLVVNKPPYIPTTPHEAHHVSLLQLVQQMPGCERAAPIHRLDAGTSGVCLFSLNPEATHRLGQELSAGQKTYTALAEGVVHKRGHLRRSLLEGRVPRAAETHYQRTSLVGTHSLLHAFPVQGRKHQIRRHFAGVGHPLLGDSKYGRAPSTRHFFERHGLDRPFLHCSRIELGSAEPRVFEAPLAPDLQAALRSLQQVAQQRKAKS